LRSAIGKHAVSGDLSQFYNSLKLRKDFYNLQRFLYRENLDINEEVLEGIIVTLIYGGEVRISPVRGSHAEAGQRL
jgi:hypothetical protein